MIKLKEFLARFWEKPKLTPEEQERADLSQEVRQQLLQLKKKGLSIPVFTL